MGGKQTKFFNEANFSEYIDIRYGKKPLTKPELLKSLCKLLVDFHEWKGNEVKYWLDCGTALGAYRNNDIIPWVDDIDLGIIQEELDKLPTREETDDWVFERNPHAHVFPYDINNRVAARFINKHNGSYLGFFAYTKHGKFMFNGETVVSKSKWQEIDTVFPLVPHKFHGKMYHVPNNLPKYLKILYNDLRVPKKYRKLFEV